MKLITFVGMGRYEPVIYRWKEHERETRFFAEALVEWFRPKTVCVVLTPEAQQSENWEKLNSLLEDRTAVREINIPSGKNEQELWEIFQKITEAVEDNDELVFDITHSFRSLPMLSLLAIAYLKQVKSVQIQHLLYAVYEAREGNVAPVFDLTPFAELLDWLTAVKMFIAAGNASEMAKMLITIHKEAWRARLPERPRHLEELAKALEGVSNSLLLSRVPLLSESVANLQKCVGTLEARAEIEKWAPALVPLMDQVSETYRPFARDDLRTQVELIEWYHQRGHIVQAVTLVREWVVSYHLQQQGKDWRDMHEREAMECMLNAEAIEDPLWSKVRDLRNDLAHCGFGRKEEQVLSVDSILCQTSKIVNEVRALAQNLPE